MENLLTLDDQAKYSEYMDDLNNSEGFYVMPTDGRSNFLGQIARICPKSEYHIYEKGERAALFAVEQQNKNKKETDHHLKLLRILNLNMEPAAAAIYYITLAAVDPFGEVNHYQAKVWEKVHTGYRLQIFRVAPYAAKSSQSIKNRCCCIKVRNLQCWMDENYLYHKCFYNARRQILTMKVVIWNNQTRHAQLLFKNPEAAREFLIKYNDNLMPYTNQNFELGWETCSRNLNQHIPSLPDDFTLFDLVDS